MLPGQVTLTEDGRAQVLHPGDTACWPAGVPIDHHACSKSDKPCSYMIVGTRVEQDICHYPNTGTLPCEGSVWPLLKPDGRLFKTDSF